MFERADTLLDEALAGGDPRRRDAASNFVLRIDRRARDSSYEADAPEPSGPGRRERSHGLGPRRLECNRQKCARPLQRGRGPQTSGPG